MKKRNLLKNNKNGILLPKLFWPTVRKIILVIKKNFWNSWPSASNLQNFEITRTIYSNSERSEQFLVTECFFTCSYYNTLFCRQRKNWKLSLASTTEMVFCYQNCSDLLWEKIVLVIEKKFEVRVWRPRICKHFEISRTICLNSERSENFLEKFI